MLSTLAQAFANEIREHDWSDAPYRLDRAGHRREHDRKLSPEMLLDAETDRVRMNVMWVAAQVLMAQDANLNLLEFAEQCGVPRHLTRNSAGEESGGLRHGLRMMHASITASATRSTFSAVFLSNARVGSTTAVILETPEDGEYPDHLVDPDPRHPGRWQRISDQEPIAYIRA